MADATAAEEAIQSLNQQFIFSPSVRLQVKLAHEPSARLSNKIFVGSLPSTISESDLKVVFQKYGNIEEIHIMGPSPRSGECCAFVRFTTAQSATRALAANGQTLFDPIRRVLVKSADSDEKKNRRQQRSMTKEPNVGTWTPPPRQILADSPAPESVPVPPALQAWKTIRENSPVCDAQDEGTPAPECGDEDDTSQSSCEGDTDSNLTRSRHSSGLDKEHWEWGLDEDSWLLGKSPKELPQENFA